MINNNKGILLTILLLVLCYAHVQAFKLISEGQPIKQPVLKAAKQNPTLNSNDLIQKGSNITDEIADFIKKQAELTFLLYRYDTNNSLSFINQRLRQAYNGDWMVCIIKSSIEGKTAVPIKDFGLSTVSENGTWWYYGRGNGVNHYWPEASYFATRIYALGYLGESTNTIFSSVQKTDYSYFANIVNGLELDISDLQTQADMIKASIQAVIPTYIPNIIVGKDVEYSCKVNYYYYDYRSASYFADNMNSTTKNKYQVGGLTRRPQS